MQNYFNYYIIIGQCYKILSSNSGHLLYVYNKRGFKFIPSLSKSTKLYYQNKLF